MRLLQGQAARAARVQGARRPHGHDRRAVPRRSHRAVAPRACRRRRERARARVRSHLDGCDPGLRGAAALRAFARARHVRQSSLRADRFLGRLDRRRRRDDQRHARSLEGHARPLMGCASGRRGRARRDTRRDALDVGHVELRADAVRRLLTALHRAGGTVAVTALLEEAVRIWNDPARVTSGWGGRSSSTRSSPARA